MKTAHMRLIGIDIQIDYDMKWRYRIISILLS